MQNIDTKILVNCRGNYYEFSTRSESGYDTTVTDKIIIKEIFEENVYQIKERDLDDTGIVVDIGQNIGVFSMYAVALGAKFVVGFEPDSYNLELLNKNIQSNNLTDKIFVNPVGIYKTQGEFELWNGQGASFIKGSKTPTPEASRLLKSGQVESQKIYTVTLEQALIANGITYADILKIDCEGSEYAIINSSTSDVLNKFRFITMEFHKTTATEFGKMIAKLSLTHNIHIIGKHNLGGQIYAHRY